VDHWSIQREAASRQDVTNNSSDASYSVVMQLLFLYLLFQTEAGFLANLYQICKPLGSFRQKTVKDTKSSNS